jgi:hypothetical protein
MEKNILRKYNVDNKDVREDKAENDFGEYDDYYDDDDIPTSGTFGRRGSITGTRLVRTMSSMDGNIYYFSKYYILY